MEKYIIHSDGGSRGNPGNAAIGVTIDKKVGDDITNIIDYKEYIGIATNNIAEYSALLWGLNYCKTNGIKDVDCYLDSELVVKQLNGQYKVKDLELSKMFVKIHNLRPSFSSLTFNHVRREYNKRADALVNEALDEQI